MIHLTCKKIPDGVTAVGLYQAVLSAFPENEQNLSYIDGLYGKGLEASAVESLYALHLLALLLDRADANWRSSAPSLCRSINGKPYFEGSRWRFNISHSRGYVAVIISDEGEVGTDMENADIAPEKAQKLAKRFFTEREIELVADAPESFCKIWSRKEAAAKYFGMPLGHILSLEKDQPEQYSRLAKHIRINCFDICKITVIACSEDNSSEIELIDFDN